MDWHNRHNKSIEWKSTVGQDPALPDWVNKESICPEGSTKSPTTNPGLCSNPTVMKACFVLQSLWAVKCCFLYVPTLTELSRLRLNGSIYSQIPTENDCSRTLCATPSQYTVVAHHSSFCKLTCVGTRFLPCCRRRQVISARSVIAIITCRSSLTALMAAQHP